MSLMTPAAIAEIFGVTETTLRSWRHRKQGPPFIKAGPHTVRYPLEPLLAWLAARSVTP